MHVCSQIASGYISSCDFDIHRYDQRVVLINKKDIGRFYIIKEGETKVIYFNLKPNKSGFEIDNFINANHVNLNVNIEKLGKAIYYNSSVSFFLNGSSEEVKTFIKQIDKSDYFVAVKFGDIIEIVNFNSSFENNSGYNTSGSLQVLNTKFPTSEPPYIYRSVSGDEVDDFDNSFIDIPKVTIGDYNEDYNEDYLK